MGYFGKEQMLPTDPLHGLDYLLMILLSDSPSFTCEFSVYSTEIFRDLFLRIYQIFLKLETLFYNVFSYLSIKSVDELL